MAEKWKVAGVHFAHMHQHDLLRQVTEQPNAEIAGIFHPEPEPMKWTAEKLAIPADRVFTDFDRMMDTAKPGLVILCPPVAEHRLWTERAAARGAHVLVEKPFAISLADADAMIAAVKKAGKQLIINWPLRWYPPHVTTKRLIDEGVLGRVQEVHYYDGNRGPLCHRGDKEELQPSPGDKAKSWWYQRASGGGSLIDYLGYGVTLGTWFFGGRAPIEVTATVDQPEGLEVDEHSVTVCRYDTGLSKYETRWGAFTDPWVNQPQPKCGFIVVGEKGTIASFDYEQTIRLQTRDHPEGRDIPVDKLQAPFRQAIEYTLHRLETGQPVEGPLDPALCRVGQQIVDTALDSARQKRTLPLKP